MPVMEIKGYFPTDKWSDFVGPIADSSKSYSESFNFSSQDYFNYLVEAWHQERTGMSSPDDIFNCDAYKEILLMGRDIEKFILKRMKSENEKPDFWFDALERLNLRFSPVNEEDAGDLRAINQTWLNWYKV